MISTLVYDERVVILHVILGQHIRVVRQFVWFSLNPGYPVYGKGQRSKIESFFILPRT